MKLLFIASQGEDYMKDCVYHGLKTVYGNQVISNNYQKHMYDIYKDKSSLYGKGFTMFCKLDINVVNPQPPEEIEVLIKEKYFDYIIYGSIHRNRDYLDLIKEYYSKDKIIMIDGEDHPSYHILASEGYPYFKREMQAKYSENIYPINFAIPKEILVDGMDISKKKDWATVIPGDLSTYIFNTEEDYYNDYRESYYGLTTKKAGWDCLRHYEIIANGCLPYFLDIENCPFYTLYNFPKELCKKINKTINQPFDQVEYLANLSEIMSYLQNNLTTDKLIEYIFDTINKKIDKSTMYNPEITLEYKRLCSPEEGQSVDIKEHLPTLFKYATECKHITEMGVRSVVSTWAFLNAYPNKLISYDIEYHPNIEKALVAGKEANIQFDYIIKDVLKTEIEETDLLFLDTWHVYEQVKQELELHALKVKKYLIFHDTTSYEWDGEGAGKKGIWPAIQEFLDTHPEWQLKERYTNNNGLTILERVAIITRYEDPLTKF